LKINFKKIKTSDYGIPVLYLIVQGYHVAISFFASVFLQKTEYGFFKLIETYCGIAIILISCGLTTLLMRFSSKNNWEGVANEFIESMVIGIIISLLLLTGGVALFNLGIVENLQIEIIILIIILSLLTSQIKNLISIFVGRKSPELVFGKIHYAIIFAIILAYIGYQNKDAVSWVKLKILCEIFIFLLLISMVLKQNKYDKNNKVDWNKLYKKSKEGLQINMSLLTRIGCDSIPIFIFTQFADGKIYAAEWGIAVLAVFFLNTGIGLYFQKCMPDLFRSANDRSCFNHMPLIKNAIKISLAILVIPVVIHAIQHAYIPWVDLNSTTIFICLVTLAFLRIPIGVFGAYCTVHQKYGTQIKLNINEAALTAIIFYLSYEYLNVISAMMTAVFFASLFNSLFSYYELQKNRI
jgi:hypothetical protein